MLIGAYTYAIFTIPVEAKEKVYQYYDCIIGFSLPIPVALVLAGLLAAVFAWLIGLPVLRLKSDYLAIATPWFCRDHQGRVPVEAPGSGHQRVQPAQELSHLQHPDSRALSLLRLLQPTHCPFSPPLFPLAVAAICITVIVLLINLLLWAGLQSHPGG